MFRKYVSPRNQSLYSAIDKVLNNPVNIVKMIHGNYTYAYFSHNGQEFVLLDAEAHRAYRINTQMEIASLQRALAKYQEEDAETAKSSPAL